MRPLKPNEQRLMLILASLAFIIANLFAFGFLRGERRSLESDIRNFRTEQSQNNFWLNQSALWSERQAWLDEKQPHLSGKGQEGGELQQRLQQSAKQQNVTVLKQVFAEGGKNPYYQEIAVQLEVKGSLEAVSRWIASLQKPEAFQAITFFNLRSDTEPPTVLATLTIARWYAAP